jgi:hypothetical protein
VPKIDWFDDGDALPRWEPRPRRNRTPGDPRERRVRLEQIIAMAATTPPTVPDGPIRRPLHLIWGEPRAQLD